MAFEFFFDLILKICSLIVTIFAVWTLIEYYTAGRVISRLEIRIHYFRNHDGKRMLHAPPLGEPKVWEVFDLITALWIMYRARAWAKSSTSGRILKIPDAAGPNHGHIRAAALTHLQNIPQRQRANPGTAHTTQAQIFLKTIDHVIEIIDVQRRNSQAVCRSTDRICAGIGGRFGRGTNRIGFR